MMPKAMHNAAAGALRSLPVLQCQLNHSAPCMCGSCSCKPGAASLGIMAHRPSTRPYQPGGSVGAPVDAYSCGRRRPMGGQADRHGAGGTPARRLLHGATAAEACSESALSHLPTSWTLGHCLVRPATAWSRGHGGAHAPAGRCTCKCTESRHASK